MTIRSISACAAALAATALAAPTAANAATISHNATTNTYTYVDDTPAGEGNAVVARMVGSKLVISDKVAQRSTTSRCVVFNGTLECNASAARLELRLGAGQDRVDYQAPHAGLVDMGPDADYVQAGHRNPSLPRGTVTVDGGDSLDWIYWHDARGPVSVTADDNLLDGVAGEHLLVHNFEAYQGSAFDDRLWGGARADTFLANGGDDNVAGGAGGDLFIATQDDGTDDYHGGPDIDGIHYGTRSGTTGVNVSLDNVANDGVPFERDQVRSNVENITGTAGNDKLLSEGAFSTIDGGAGNDYIDGATGNDVLIGGQGRDTLIGGPGVDNLAAADREPDTLDCGTDRDLVTRDTFETKIMRCESDFVGILRLDRRAVRAAAGETTEIGLGWRHPLRWRLLRSVTLSVADGPARVGSIELDLHSGRAVASGEVRLARGRVELETEGRDVRAQLPVRFDATLQGRKLTLDVEAREHSGRRQVVQRAGTVRVR